MDVPLFPLSTVLFPGGPLPLRIFESRYIDMISHCMKNDAPFGVLLIREGSEAGPEEREGVSSSLHLLDGVPQEGGGQAALLVVRMREIS